MLLPAELPCCLCSRLPHFWGLVPKISETVVFYLPCHWGASPGPLGEVILPGANGWFDLEERLVLLESWDEGLRLTTEPSEVQ
jgi:hypothetical protein